MRLQIIALFSLLAILGACATTGDGASKPQISLHEVGGACNSDVDLVIRGVPVRLALRYAAAINGPGHSGTIDLVTQFGSLACIFDGERRACEAAPGALPFAPRPAPDMEGGGDATE